MEDNDLRLAVEGISETVGFMSRGQHNTGPEGQLDCAQEGRRISSPARPRIARIARRLAPGSLGIPDAMAMVDSEGSGGARSP